MPWYTRLRRGAGLPFVFLTLTLGVVVSCVTVASSADGPGDSAPLSRTTAVATGIDATSAPTVEPVVAADTTDPPISFVVDLPDPSAIPTTSAVPTREAPIPAGDSMQATTAPRTLAPATPAASIAASEASAPSALTAEDTTVPVAPPRTVGPVDARLDGRTRRKLDQILGNTVKNKGVAGLQAAVRLPSGETWLGTAGKAEYSPDRSIDASTQFAIASITKTFISALVLQLAEEGKIDLDAPFGTYFKDAPRSKNVTVRQLLSHTSGIYNYFENPRYYATSRAWLRAAPTGLDSREHRWRYDEIMDLVKPGYCKPGRCYHYSNTNYVILGKVAEAVGGAPLHKQLRKRFFKPLGMDDTVFQPAERPRGDAAHGHWGGGTSFTDHTRNADVLPFMAAVTAADAAGAIASTARDLSVWADALYGGELLSPESTRAMTTFLLPGTYGLGADVASFSGNRGHGHRGGLRGFESSMWYFPESGVTVVLLSNHGNWITDEPMGRLVKTVLGRR